MAKDKEFDEVYQYFKEEILRYHDKKVPKYVILRLIGLKDGKFMANNNVKSDGVYSYKIILLTLKLIKGSIDRYMDNTEFSNEQHMINGIFKIVENEINNVKDRIENAKKSEDKIKEIDLSHHKSEQVEFKSKNKKNKKMKGLW